MPASPSAEADLSNHWRRSPGMKALAIASLLLLSAPAAAQRPRVSVPLYPGDMPCSTASIMHIEPADAYVSIRAGPSRRDLEIARLRNGDSVFACVRDGGWFGIVFEQPDRGQGCGVSEPTRSTTYTGPCRSGWVSHRHIGGYADWISP